MQKHLFDAKIKSLKMKKFVHKNVLTPILDLLKQGLTPQKLAMSLAAGAVISCFPIFGTTTLLCIIAAHIFRLNHVAIQLANYLCYPLQIILMIPFIHFGNKIFGYENMTFSLDDMTTHFQIDPQGFFETYLGVFLRASAAWILFVPFGIVMIYFPLKFVLLRLPTQPK